MCTILLDYYEQDTAYKSHSLILTLKLFCLLSLQFLSDTKFAALQISFHGLKRLMKHALYIQIYLNAGNYKIDIDFHTRKKDFP